MNKMPITKKRSKKVITLDQKIKIVRVFTMINYDLHDNLSIEQILNELINLKDV